MPSFSFNICVDVFYRVHGCSALAQSPEGQVDMEHESGSRECLLEIQQDKVGMTEEILFKQSTTLF